MVNIKEFRVVYYIKIQELFFTPCAAHNLNLLIKDAANSSTIALLFFGTIERIYSIFSSSTQRWDILKKHCNLLTVKKWAETRWESRL